MFLSAMSVLVVAQSSSEITEGLMNNPIFQIKAIYNTSVLTPWNATILQYLLQYRIILNCKRML